MRRPPRCARFRRRPARVATRVPTRARRREPSPAGPGVARRTIPTSGERALLHTPQPCRRLGLSRRHAHQRQAVRQARAGEQLDPRLSASQAERTRCLVPRTFNAVRLVVRALPRDRRALPSALPSLRSDTGDRRVVLALGQECGVHCQRVHEGRRHRRRRGAEVRDRTRDKIPVRGRPTAPRALANSVPPTRWRATPVHRRAEGRANPTHSR
jgi:hypothetical protein